MITLFLSSHPHHHHTAPPTRTLGTAGLGGVVGIIITVVSPLGGLFWGLAALLGAVGTTKPPANVWMVIGVEIAEALLYFLFVLRTDNVRLRSVPVVRGT